MKSSILGFAALCLSLTGHAQLNRAYRIPDDVDAAGLSDQLQAKSFQVERFEQRKSKRFLVLRQTESKDPTALIEALLPPDTKEARALTLKLRAGTITQKEKDRLLMLLASRLLDF